MAMLLFIDFDASLGSAQGTGPTTWPDWPKPPGVFHYSGVVAQDRAQYGSALGCPTLGAGRNTGSSAIFLNGNVASPSSYNSAGGYSIGVKRTTYSIGDEIFACFDICMSGLNGGGTGQMGESKAQGGTAASIFRCGDVGLYFKSLSLVVSTYTVVFALFNASTEVATITVPNITLATTWMHVKMSCKLHSSTGYITCTIDGVSQSASYTGQNTVSVNAANSSGTTATADHVYFGPPVMYNTILSNSLPGGIDNIHIDDTAVPTHRPRGSRVSLSGSSTDVNAVAVGTGASSIIDALSNPTDAKAARFNGASAETIMDLASISTSGIESAVLGFNLYAKRPANRNANAARHLSMGLDISGVQTMGTAAVAVTLPISSVTTPPNTDYAVQGLFEGIYTAGITTSNLANVKVRLLTS